MIQFPSGITGSVHIIVSHNDIDFFFPTPNVCIFRNNQSVHTVAQYRPIMWLPLYSGK